MRTDDRNHLDLAAGRLPVAPAQISPVLHQGTVLLLAALMLWRAALPMLNAEHFGADEIQDFAAIVTFAKGFWHGHATYSTESFLSIQSERVGRAVDQALPFPYSPTMLWILAPFTLLPTAWSYAVWTVLGMFAVWWMARRRSVWLSVALFSPAAFTCVALGQTSFLSTAALLYLMTADLNSKNGGSANQNAANDLRIAIILAALTAKPPFAFTAGIMLLVRHRWRPVALAAGFTVFSTLLLTPLLGSGWVRQYVHLMTHYDLQTADPVYRWSLFPETMGNLRAVLHVTFGIGDATASHVSTMLWLLALTCILVAGRRGRISAPAYWSLGVLAYLTLCPHVTSTEELHLVLLLALFTHPALVMVDAGRRTAMGLVIMVLFLSPAFGHLDLRVPIIFAAHVLLAGLVCTQWRLRAVTMNLPGGMHSACTDYAVIADSPSSLP